MKNVDLVLYDLFDAIYSNFLFNFISGFVWNEAFFRQIQSQKIQITGTISIKERLCLYYEESP